MSDVLMRVTWVDYTPKQDEGDPPLVRLAGRSPDGERIIRHVEGCLPHMYLPENEPIPNDRGEDFEIVDVAHEYETFDGVPVKKLTLRHPKQVNVVEDMVTGARESDIPFYRRATWDYGLYGYLRVPDAQRIHVDEIDHEAAADVDPIQPRTAIGDLEVNDTEDRSFEAMKEAADAPICAATLHDTYTEEYVVAVVDPEERAEGSDVRDELASHWGDHELADTYLDGAQVTFLQCDSEADLLNSLIGRIQDWQPDLLSGWNWLGFDHDYLVDRCEALDDVIIHDLSDVAGVGGRKTETLITGLPGFDQMEAYEDKVTLSENRSSALEYIASEELGIGKIPAMDVATAYEDDRSRLAAYNLLDVQLCAALTDKHAIEEFYLDLADLTGIQVYDVFYEKRLVDGWIASRADDDQVLPNQREKDIPEPAGGLVLSPSQGVTEDVAVFDLKSLYPSSIISCNISPETQTQDPDEADIVIPGMPEKEADVGGSITEDDINWDDWDDDLPWSMRPKGFTLDDRGIVSEAAEGPFYERGRYKMLRDDYGPDDDMYVVYDRKQGAVKVVHNSMYGVLNSDYYRLATEGMGDAITGVSRYVLWRAAQQVEAIGYEVIYGDTDSVLVKMPGDRPLKKKLLDAKGLVSQLNTHMQQVAEDLGLPAEHPHIDASEMPHGLDDDANHLWFFEFEKFYDAFIQCGQKKRYAGLLAWKEGKTVDEIGVTGFESQRADVPKVTAEVQDEVIERVLKGQTFDQVSEYVRDEIDDIRQFAHLEEIGIPKSIGKPLDEYPNMARVRAARHSNHHLGYEFGPSDTFWMFYAARTPVGTEGTDVFGVEWNEGIPDDYDVDEEKTITKAFESALTPIVEEMGWSFTEVRSGMQQQSAEEETGFDGDPFERSSEGTGGAQDDADADGTDDEGEDTWEGAEAW